MAPWTKRQFGRCAAFFNVFLNSKKSMPISSMQHFLGCLNDFTPLRNDLAIVFGCKYATRQKCLKLINEHLASGVMGSAAASKLRGVTQWVDRNLMGRPCRGALCALTARQYFEKEPGDAITPWLRKCLHYLAAAIINTPDRSISFAGQAKAPLIMYTDCSAQGTHLILGLLLIRPCAAPLCYSTIVPQNIVQAWKFRTQYVGQGELLAGPLAASIFSPYLQNEDLIWFLDNTSAVTALIKAGSPIHDNSEMALITALKLSWLRCRAWFEYVHTKSNPADPLSRDGFQSSYVREKLFTGEWQKLSVKQIDWHSLIKYDSNSCVWR